MGDALTEAREALAQIDHPCGVRHSAADLEGVEEVCALAPGHLGAHYGCGPFVDWKEHLRAALAEVDRLTRERDAYRRAKEENDERYMIERDEARREVDGLTTRVAELEARAGDVQRIAAHVRAFRVDASAKRAPWGLMFRLISDAIERGDWRDAPLPPDPRDARIAALEAASPRWTRRFDAAPWFLVVGTVRLPGSGIVRHPTTDRCWETETCEEHPNEVAAARAVCARLGLPEILTGLSDAAGVLDGSST